MDQRRHPASNHHQRAYSGNTPRQTGRLLARCTTAGIDINRLKWTDLKQDGSDPRCDECRQHIFYREGKLCRLNDKESWKICGGCCERLLFVQCWPQAVKKRVKEVEKANARAAKKAAKQARVEEEQKAKLWKAFQRKSIMDKRYEVEARHQAGPMGARQRRTLDKQAKKNMQKNEKFKALAEKNKRLAKYHEQEREAIKKRRDHIVEDRRYKAMTKARRRA